MAPPNRFSDRLKTLIEGSGVSRFVLCRQAGISEAVLSRFLAGKQGLTLVTLDKLADVLGLELTVTVQKTPKPKPRGRKRPVPQGEPKMTAATLARLEAKYAHETLIQSRRGTYEVDDAVLGRPSVVYYNNNPYANFPDLRDEETAELRLAMREAGIEELAYATYPATGEEADYSFAMVLAAGPDQIPFITETITDICRRSYQRMDATHG